MSISTPFVLAHSDGALHCPACGDNELSEEDGSQFADSVGTHPSSQWSLLLNFFLTIPNLLVDVLIMHEMLLYLGQFVHGTP